MDNDKLPQRFLDFSRKVFLIGSRYHERNIAKEDLHNHLERVKKASLSKKQRGIVKELEYAESKIAALIEKEKSISNSDFPANKELLEDIRKKDAQINESNRQIDGMKKLIEKNKERANELSSLLKGLKEKLKVYMEKDRKENERRKRVMKHLDSKIHGEVDVEDYLS